ncbi:MAG: RNA methyltransferase [Amoebophilaceae bacterium]|nr:RNA methyltransferase [Amoebophilaceae bacterium]
MYSYLSKNKATYIRQLAAKKYRLQENCFVLEGKKNIQSLLDAPYSIRYIVGTPAFFSQHQDWFTALPATSELFEADERLLSSLASLQHNHEVLAVVEIPKVTPPVLPSTGITLALDTIQDPGNLGTIIRIADWYGVTQIICSETTVDLYNPKVLQVSMGSFLQVKLHYLDLPLYLKQVDLPIIGTAPLGGRPLHTFSFPNQGILVIGNETHGIHPTTKQLLTTTLTIAKYGKAESLNAAMATAVICDNWKRYVNG